MRWLRTHWVPMVAAVVGLGLGAATGSAGVKSKTTTNTVTATTTVTDTSTVTKTVASHAKPRVIVQTRTETQTVTAPAALPAPAPASGGGGGGGPYSGDGEKNVGNITVAQDSTLHWTCSGDCSVFGISSDVSAQTNAISVDSANSATSGDTAVPAGNYPNVQVISTGSWSFTISPG